MQDAGTEIIGAMPLLGKKIQIRARVFKLSVNFYKLSIHVAYLPRT